MSCWHHDSLLSICPGIYAKIYHLELHVLQNVSVRRYNKNKGVVRLFQISQKEIFFLLLWQPSALGGNLTMRLPLSDSQRNAFLCPSVWSRSIVCIGVSTPSQKTPPSLSWQALLKTTLNLQTAQDPLFRQSLLFISFWWNHPSESQIFHWMPKY